MPGPERWDIVDGVCTAPVDDHLLIGRCGEGEIRLVNSTAAFVWACLADGLSLSQIARDVSAAFRISVERAREDVRTLLRDLDEAGLVSSGTPVRQAQLGAKAPAIGEVGETVDLGTARCRLGGRRFAVTYLASAQLDQAGREFVDRVAAMLSGIADENDAAAPGALGIEFRVGTASLSVRAADFSWSGTERPAAVLELYSLLLGAAYGPIDWLCRLHAASVARGGVTLVLPAPTASGKSTLSAYLAAQGWEYLGDDIATIDPRLGVLPFPTAIGLKEGSLPVLHEMYPDLRQLRAYRYGEKTARYVVPPKEGSAAAPRAISALVFAKFDAAQEPSIRRLHAPQAAARLMATGANLSGGLTAAKLAWFAEFLCRTPCHEMSYSSLAAAQEMLGSLSHQ